MGNPGGHLDAERVVVVGDNRVGEDQGVVLLAGTRLAIGGWRPEQAGPTECLALYAGAHGRANGLGTLLDAAAILRARGETRLRILLVGEGAEKPALITLGSKLIGVQASPPD